MAGRKPTKLATPPDDDLGAGIGIDDVSDEQLDENVEDELVKIHENPAPPNRFGIVVEDLDISAVTGVESPALPEEPEDHTPPPMTPSAQARLDAEMKMGRETLKKMQAGK